MNPEVLSNDDSWERIYLVLNARASHGRTALS